MARSAIPDGIFLSMLNTETQVQTLVDLWDALKGVSHVLWVLCDWISLYLWVLFIYWILVATATPPLSNLS